MSPTARKIEIKFDFFVTLMDYTDFKVISKKTFSSFSTKLEQTTILKHAILFMPHVFIDGISPSTAQPKRKYD